jgi:nucleoside-diphosphate-sugar epimerase
MNRVLITGVDGFIGSHLANYLDDKSDVLVARRSDGDIRLGETWNSFPKVDTVIHLAEKNSVLESWTCPGSYISSNINSITNALEFCKKNNCGIIYLSSYLYGNCGELPINESYPVHASNPYAFSKILTEKVCNFYFNHYHVPVTIIRPFNVYGNGQSENFLIPSLITKILDDNHQEIVVEDLAPRRDYIYIDDLIELISLCMSGTNGFHLYNAGSGKSYSVLEVINIIQEILNIDKKIITKNNKRPNEINNCVADISLANKDLAWTPRWDLHHGLSQIIKIRQGF